MSVVALTGFLLLAAIAAFAQTLTGFAFGLLTMGGIGLTGLISLPDAAALVSILTFVNATQMLLKGWRDVAWRQFAIVMVTNIPMLFVGYETLVTVFALNVLVRTGIVTASGNLPGASTLAGLLAIPVVMGATHAARKWPPLIPPQTLRRIVFVLLFLSGVAAARWRGGGAIWDSPQ